jgi:hypothetical protein
MFPQQKILIFIFAKKVEKYLDKEYLAEYNKKRSAFTEHGTLKNKQEITFRETKR